jgi:hypothetical protein
MIFLLTMLGLRDLERLLFSWILVLNDNLSLFYTYAEVYQHQIPVHLQHMKLVQSYDLRFQNKMKYYLTLGDQDFLV